MNDETVRNWIRKAESDLKIARDELHMSDPATDAICFHCQQCCEKYLKAFLVHAGKEIPRTHSLARLAVLCAELDEQFVELEKLEIDRLTEYATTLRYAEDFRMPPVDEAQSALEVAEKVRGMVRKSLINRGLTLE